jgi:hopene-associated glycosyltransferase HpnB
MGVALAVAAASLGAWLGLLLGRGWFWWPTPQLSGSERNDPSQPESGVLAVIPAREEAAILPETLPTVLGQSYSGSFHVVLVDDCSDDRTAEIARTLADDAVRGERLTVIQGTPRPTAWTGKPWALNQAVARISSTASGASAGERPEFLWFTDADIAHASWILKALVHKAESERLDLVSIMARLRADSFWDRLLIPAFVYFFAKLYPFRFVGTPRRRAAGAAGGCILLRREALERAGGLGAIRAALIDDCALATIIKRANGRLWLGYCQGVRCVRRYGTLASIWAMVSRSAYTQLGHSPFALAGTIHGMLFLYALPPCAVLGGAVALLIGHPLGFPTLAVGGATWILMGGSFVPLLRWHHVHPWMAWLLPLAGVLYTAMTVSSAWSHGRGRGGAWKGRTY